MSLRCFCMTLDGSTSPTWSVWRILQIVWRAAIRWPIYEIWWLIHVLNKISGWGGHIKSCNIDTSVQKKSPKKRIFASCRTVTKWSFNRMYRLTWLLNRYFESWDCEKTTGMVNLVLIWWDFFFYIDKLALNIHSISVSLIFINPFRHPATR